MLNKTFALAALAGATLLATAPAFADGYRDRGGYRHHDGRRVVVVRQHAPHYAQRRWIEHRAQYPRPVYAYRPAYVRPAPVVTYRRHSSHDVLGGLIVGAMIGAVIANHARY
jgi:hypothetical protein